VAARKGVARGWAYGSFLLILLATLTPQPGSPEGIDLTVGTRMDCIFCRIDRPLFAETRLSFAFLDGFPVSNGHTLVIPKRHVVSLWEMSDNEYTDAFDLVRRVKDILQEKFQPQGLNVGVNCGEAAGQSVFHAHIHIIPRYNGDVPSPRGGVRNIIPGKGNY
jgi:diadenosine tetraphosphate (Ap4A) HIT family hydrolase